MSKSDYANTYSKRFDKESPRLVKRDKQKNKTKEKRINAALKTKDVLYLNDIEDAL